MKSKNDRVCKLCLARRGEHYFTETHALSCAPHTEYPYAPLFQWNGEFSERNSKVYSSNPNQAFRRKKYALSKH